MVISNRENLMLLFLYISSILSLLFFQKYRFFRGISIFYALIVCCIFIAGNHTNLDYENYAVMYDVFDEGHNNEWLYRLLRLVGVVYLRIDYDHFRLLMTVLILFVLYKSVLHYFPIFEEYLCSFFALFMIFPLIWDILVYRNFCSFVIFVHALRYLEKYSIKNLILYTLCILLAAGIQFSFIVYLLLVSVYWLKNRSSIKKITLVIAMLSSVVTFLPAVLLDYVQKIMFALSENRTSYTSEIGTRYGFVLFWVYQLLYFGLAKYGKNFKDLIICDMFLIESEHRLSHIVDLVYYISIVLFIFCPLYRIQGNFTRLLFNAIPLLYLQYFAVKQLAKNNISYRSKLVKYKWFIVSVAVLFFIMSVGLKRWEDIIVPAFSDNWIL